MDEKEKREKVVKLENIYISLTLDEVEKSYKKASKKDGMVVEMLNKAWREKR